MEKLSDALAEAQNGEPAKVLTNEQLETVHRLAYVPPIHEALADVMAEIKAVPKGEKFAARGMESYNFRGIDAVVNAVGPMLRKHRILGPVPELVSVDYETVPVGKDKVPTGFARVVVRYWFIGPAGDRLSCEVPGTAMDRGDKAIGKAMSVAERIALIQTLCLPTHEPDPDSEAYEVASAPAPVASSDDIAAEVARAELIHKIDKLGLDRAQVRKAYQIDTGHDVVTDMNADRIRSFTDRLEPGK